HIAGHLPYGCIYLIEKWSNKLLLFFLYFLLQLALILLQLGPKLAQTFFFLFLGLIRDNRFFLLVLRYLLLIVFSFGSQLSPLFYRIVLQALLHSFHFRRLG